MSPRLSTVVLLSLFLLLLGFAYSPLLRSGLLAGDYARLLDPSASAAEPLSSLWTRASRSLWGLPQPGTSAPAFRLENLLVLLGAALSLRAFYERVLAPWAGVEQARSAATCGALLFALHPLSCAAVASLEARGACLGLLFGSGASALFLWGRQEGRYALTAASLVLCALAALSARFALACPFLLAGAEYLSAHRYRPRALRLRTSLTTLVVFGAGAALALLPGLAEADVPSAGGALAGLSGGSWRQGAASAIEELGLLVLPSNPAVLGAGGSVLAGGLFLLALQPAFLAARSAPRLWGGALLVWVLLLLGALLWHPSLRARAREFDLAWGSLPAAAIVAAGLGLAVTALSGSRRLALSALLATGYAGLGHANAWPWRGASAEVAALRIELALARDLSGEAPLLVLDPPGPRQGIDPLRGSIAWLLHPVLDGRDGLGDPARVRGLSSAAFLALASEDEFALLRARAPVVLAPSAALAGTEQGSGRRSALVLGPGEPSGEVPAWRRSLRSPPLDLDPFEFEAVRVTAELETPPSELERIRWRTRGGGLVETGSVRGVALEEGGARSAVFDLSRSLAWRLGGRIRYLFVEQGERPIERGDPLEHLPSLGEGLGPRPDGEDWVFDRPEAGRIPAAGRPGSFVLTLLSLADYECREVLAEPEPPNRLRARGVGLFAGRSTSRGAPLCWSLDYRIDGLAVARARGRLP